MGTERNRWVKVKVSVGGPPQKVSSNILISTLQNFILGSRNSDIGPTDKSLISLIIQNPPSNPMASIRSLFAMWLPLYTGIPYLLNVRAWGELFLCPNVGWFRFKVSPIVAHTNMVPKSTLWQYYWIHDRSTIVKSYRKFKDAAHNCISIVTSIILSESGFGDHIGVRANRGDLKPKSAKGVKKGRKGKAECVELCA